MKKQFKILDYLKKIKLGLLILLFNISQFGLSQERKNIDIITIYNQNISWLNTVISVLIGVITILSILLLVAYAILAERKVLGSIQKRRGPNLVGIFGLLQPIADAVKLIVKETIIPVLSNRIIFVIAPLLTLILSLLNWSIIPFSNHAVLADIRVSILMFFALSSLTVYGIIMSGWASNSKYAFLGALRAAAQVIAYEVSIGLTLIYILIQTSDLNYFKIIWSQIEIWNIVPCFIFFILFFISTLAETNRPPFDLPEAEAELVSGYNVEYSAMSFGFFFLGEYVSIWTVCCLNIILFWGGFFTIFAYESILLYSLKVISLVITFIWVRGSLPRYRYDQLMRLGWKILLPISLGFVILYCGIYYEILYWILEKNLIEVIVVHADDTIKNIKEIKSTKWTSEEIVKIILEVQEIHWKEEVLDKLKEKIPLTSEEIVKILLENEADLINIVEGDNNIKNELTIEELRDVEEAVKLIKGNITLDEYIEYINIKK